MLEGIFKYCDANNLRNVNVCVSLFYVIDTGSIRPRARIPGTELGVAYLPSTISSDADYDHLPLPLLGAPVDIGSLVKLGSRSLAKQDRDWSSRPPGTGLHAPFRRHRGSAAIHPSRSRD
jgi:hypothetical protein